MKFLIPIFVALGAAISAARAADTFPQPFNTEPSPTHPLPAEEAAAKWEVPPGFHVTAFAGEPDVQQPIAMTTDARGRLWVVENYTYAERATGYEERLRDRILIFEDTDNDGHFDKRTVFWEGAQRLTSIEVGLGGVWALCLPDLLFIPDKNGDDIPDGEPVRVLDGFDYLRGRHTMANGLRWGPDGWLYGRQGILTTSLVGAPGMPEKERTKMNVGIWRYHPARQVFEVVAEGTTNPWGMDWDARGEAFFINTVIGHLWHVIPGAHYRRMSGGDLNSRIYDVIEQHADHVHWATSEKWTDVRKGVTDATLAAGGGHAHTGLLIYQGGQWPAEWNGKLLTDNFHGRRFNVERLERTGTGFVGMREPEAFLSADPWFRGIDLIAAPDGGVFVSDWSDAGECHDNDGIHRTSGRIFKITYGEAQPRTTGDLARLDGAELAALQLSPNDWLARMSRRVLADRAVTGADQSEAREALQRLAAQDADVGHRLRALWALNLLGAPDPAQLTALLDDPDEAMRVWAIRLLEDRSHADAAAREAFGAVLREKLPALAAQETSGLVRLTLASLLQKLPVAERPALAAALLAHGEDADDHNQPLMLWCGILPIAETAGDAFISLIAEAKIPRVQRYGARRLAEDIDSTPEKLDALLVAVAERGTVASKEAVLGGIADGLSGRRKAPKPASWDGLQAKLAAGADEAVQTRLRNLGAMFGDGLALDSIRAAALDPANSFTQRRAALQVLVDANAPGLRETCERLLAEPELTATAAAGLALFDDPAIADRLLAAWPKIPSEHWTAITNILISRPAWVPKLLDAIADGRVENHLNSFQLRQLRGYQDATLTQRLDAMFGKVAAVGSGAKDAALAKWKKRLAPAALAQADKVNGRVVFQTTCAACHTLNGEGGAIGPDLTGAARDNLDYLLENILTPSAVVADEFRQTTLTLKDGRVLAGMVKARTERTLKLQTPTETIDLETAEVAKEEVSPLSLMPEGSLDLLDGKKARDLIGYLMSKEPPAPTNSSASTAQ